MTSLNIWPIYRLHQISKSAWGVRSWFWPGGASDGVLSTSRLWLRRFLLLKLVTVLLFPHRAGLPLLVGCMFSLRALLLLRSPHISTKPSTVFLCQLALTDVLLPLHWVLQLGQKLTCWMEADVDESVWYKEAVSLLGQQLLDAHHLASLLLLGLLGLEAMLVLRWPLQTRTIRTSHWAQFSCSLVWVFVLLELLLMFSSKLLQDSQPQMYPITLQNPQSSPHGLVDPASLTAFSFCPRRILWLINLWLHYNVIYSKPPKRKSSFH
ncbi:uncharacterized protein LOC115427395 [Sphaeramia orbicularis]|uniref:uncharacterized protein LOC115427395 n=1 Tax=Sphaeramia orbicularis TaxID=375764 RepID=UPI00117E5692|nr:uncharacterized protein LOC115427395 [Sphaeramia orbicularis]